MPPKRAARTAAKAAPVTDKKTPATRGNRSRVQKSTPPQEEQPEVNSAVRSTRSRNSTITEQDAPAQEEQAEAAATSDAITQPRTKQRPLTRGRPPRTVKKPAPSQANKGALDALKARMEEDRRATKAGVVPQPAPQSRSQQAEHAVRVATNNDGDAAMVPARPVPRSPSPARQTAVPGTAVKAPASVARPQSALKMQSTPGAETSVLALQNFRRRPRQPSLLQMVQNPELAGTPIDDTTDFTLGSLGDEDDFAPHDESTPLQLAKGRPIEVDQEPEEDEDEEEQLPEQDKAQTPEAALPEDDDEFYGATPQKSTRQSRKRKSDAIEESEIQIVRSSPSLPSPSRSIVEHEYETIPATAPDDEEEEAATTESQQRRLLSDTYADPLSSSPPPEPISPNSPEQHRQTPAISPSAIRKSARAGGQSKKAPKPLTTATLRAMLPKRRAQRKDEFDFSSSSAHEANSSAFEEEKRKRAKAKKPTTSKKTAPAKVTKKPTTAAASKRTSRTYARSNKENNPVHISSGSSSLSELNSDELEADETADTSLDTIKGGKSDDKLSEELRKARDKFAEVDDWEMEFESASLGGGEASSPWR
ncbi:hypothetical protein D6C98_09309 [Aureobasidium pullulans]|uniref:Uncharacterized protein n=1 Tax=Aureobasidium pullulans TaxID=5580 RepID=A0A4S8WM89_AURPU|nr:hypothetical protein D6D23_04722 [Aureobasidium pullulans]THW55678.1 hypothetical protein D6D20_09297 [Aureobasidium pullulans]THY41334.1 hypothetical protein D6C98_09309 [Aureobasidium pullulans]